MELNELDDRYPFIDQLIYGFGLIVAYSFAGSLWMTAAFIPLDFRGYLEAHKFLEKQRTH